MVRLSQKAQVTLFGICVAGLIFGGAGYAQAKSTQAAYEEQSKQMKLYKQATEFFRQPNIPKESGFR